MKFTNFWANLPAVPGFDDVEASQVYQDYPGAENFQTGTTMALRMEFLRIFNYQ